MNTLINYLDYLVRLLKLAYNTDNKKALFNQAYGACQYHMLCHPDNVTEEKVTTLWNDVYRPKFEQAIYGKEA